jgi:predicted dinucleotide-binding enzyme
MSYAIVGFGAVGQALARAFARKGIEVAATISGSVTATPLMPSSPPPATTSAA